MGWQGSLLPLFWLFLFIFLIQIVLTKFKWIKVPSVLAYILMGMFISNYAFNGFQDEQMDWLNGLSQFGLYYLMFLSGMEMDLNLLRFRKGSKLRHNPLVIGLSVFLGSSVLAYLFGLRMHQIDHSVQSWMIMLILLTTSLGIVMPVLKENGLLKSQYGQMLLTSAILADLITMIILSLVAGSYQAGFTLRQASIGLFLPLLIICYQLIVRLRSTSFWENEIQKNSVFKLQGVLAILGLYGVLTDLAGSEPILGSFLAGILLSSFRFNEYNPFKQQLEVIGYGFIIPIFFIMIGYNFNVSEFLASPNAMAWVPLLITTAYTVKLIPMAFLGPMYGVRRAIAGGFLLSSRMTLIVVAASIGLRLGVISTDLEDAVLVVAIITSIVSPLIFTFSHKKAHL